MMSLKTSANVLRSEFHMNTLSSTHMRPSIQMPEISWLRSTCASARTVSVSKFWWSTPFCSRSTRASSSSSADCCDAPPFALPFALPFATPFFSGDFTSVSSSAAVDASVVADLARFGLRSFFGFCTTFSDCVALAAQSSGSCQRHAHTQKGDRQTALKSTRCEEHTEPQEHLLQIRHRHAVRLHAVCRCERFRAAAPVESVEQCFCVQSIM